MENRTLIMNCAKELFYAKGYDAVGVQEIVDRAGITKPTLYYYFGSKLGLLKTLLEVKFQDPLAEVEKAAKAQSDIRSALYHMAKAYCDFFEKDREFYMLAMALVYSARENEAYQAIQPYITELYKVVVEAFERASGQLGNMYGRQRQFATGFIGIMNQYFLYHCEADEKQQCRISDEKITSLVNQFMYGIFT